MGKQKYITEEQKFKKKKKYRKEDKGYMGHWERA